MADTEYRIVVDSSGAVREIDRFGRALTDADRAADELSDSLQESGRRSSNFNLNLLAANAGAELASTAFSLLKRSVTGIFDGLDRGREVANDSRAFEDLQRSVGQVGEDTLPRLREATGGLIDDLTLMTEANKAVVLGLPTKGFEDAAEAAIKLGRAQGVDALGSIQALTEGVGKASPEILNNIGVVVKAEEAYKRFAEANNVTVAALDDNQRKLAVQEEAYRQLFEASNQLSDGTADVASVVDQLTVQWTNLTDDLAIAANENENLRDAIGRVGQALAQIDIDAVIEGLSRVVDAIAVVIDAVANIIPAVQKSFNFFVDTISEVVVAAIEFKESIQGIFGIAEASAANLDSLSGAVDGLGGATKSSTAEFDKFKGIAQGVTDDLKALEGQNERTTETTLSLGRQFIANMQKQREEVKRLSTENTRSSREFISTSRERGRALQEEARELQAAEQAYTRWIDSLELAVSKSEDYSEVLRELNSGLISAEQAGDRLKDIYTEKARELTELNANQEEYGRLLEEMGRGAEVSSERLGELAQSIGQVKEQAAVSNSQSGSFLDGLFGGDVSQGFGNQIGGTIASALGNAISSAVRGGSIRDAVGGLTSALGGALGTAFGGPLGGAAGSAFGSVIGEQISKIGESTKSTVRRLGELSAALGGVPLVLRAAGVNIEDFAVEAFGLGDTPGTTARKAVDRYFGELFDGQRITALINGELESITDFQFSGNQTGGLFDGLAAGAQESFTQVGLAFESLLGISSDLAVNTGTVLANNLGGSLNNLQVVLQRAGLSTEELRGQLVQTFLDGGKSAVEIQKQMTAVAQLAEKGIPGAVGATVEAFQNLQQAGVEGGAFTVDALRDIGSEAKELSIETLPELMSNIVGSGEVNAEAVKNLFEALKQFGISSVEELENVSDETAIAILANLESNNFPFEETTQKIRDIEEAIRDIPQTVDRTLRFRVQVDANASDRSLIEQSRVEIPFNGPAPGRG